MSNGESFYTFLPWLRTGVGARLAQSPTGTARASLNLKLQIEGDGQVRQTVNRSVDLYGPGDILGVNTSTIIHTVPPRGTRNFESNFLAAIEFYGEDFPWRYSPVAPVADRVAPWLWLLVLEEGEFDLLPPFAAALPIVRLHANVNQSAFPKPNQSWAWAHAHLNFKVADTENADLRAALAHAQSELNQNPNLGCSRLVSPRRLKEETAYTAFLIPAFEKGRIAGLGADVSLIDSTSASQLSWQTPQALFPDHFPVYYHWSFSTMKGGDFEQLASKITPITKNELLQSGVGVPLKMDIRSPGWGVTHHDAERTVNTPAVFRLPETPPEPEFPAPASTNDNAWTDAVAQLLNLSVDMQEANADFNKPNPVYADAATVGNDPVVTPPLYGSWYVPPSPLDKSKMKTDWYQQLNLHPAMRVVGGVGAEVIRDNQEDYMERAWEQYEEIRETNRFISLAQLSSTTSTAMLSKHMSGALNSLTTAAPSNQQVRGLRLAAMSQTAKVVEGGTARAQALSLASPVAMKMFRPNGALMSRVTGSASTAPIAANFWLKDLKLHVFRDDSVVPSDLVVMAMTNSVAAIPNHAVLLISVQGLSDLQTALDTHKSYFKPLISIFIAPLKLRTDLALQFRPDLAIMKKVNSRLPDAARSGSQPNDVSLLRVTPEFIEPMFDELARQSLDFVMPGVDKFPVDRCGVFESNRTFVEAFLVGLNHEMSREMLWREFPANLTATFFSQFWDKSDTPASSAASSKDIKPVREWARPSSFGHATHRVGTSLDPLFFVIRGDLLRKYPNTVVFMQRAKPGVFNPRVPDESDAAIKLPIASARIEPDIFFVGFDVSAAEAKGNPQNTGWFIVLQERPGDIHFGLDQNVDAGSPTEPHWDNSGVEPGQCVDLGNGKPLFAGLRHAADTAMLFYQQPFMVLIHASKMIP